MEEIAWLSVWRRALRKIRRRRTRGLLDTLTREQIAAARDINERIRSGRTDLPTVNAPHRDV